MSMYFAENPGKIEVVSWYANNEICLQEVRFSVPISEWNKFLNSKLYRELELYIDGLKIQDMHTDIRVQEYTRGTAELKQSQKKRPLLEIMEDFSKATYGKECRKIHRELRKYYNSGLPLFARYPNLPLYISVATLTFGIMVSIAMFALFHTTV